MGKNAVTISRYWDKPQILTKVTLEEISLTIELNDFVKALVEEIGSVASLLTKKSFEQRVGKALESVLSKIKEESTKVI